MKEENLLPFTTKLNTVTRNIVGEILLLTLPSTNPPHGHSALYQAPAGLCVQVNALLLPIQGGLPMSNPTKLIVGACYLKMLGRHRVQPAQQLLVLTLQLNACF